MKKCLYEDFYEGLLHLLIMILPLIIGTFNELLAGNTALIPVSLIISIATSFYSCREVYKNKEFSDVMRIKRETVCSLVLLAISLCLTLYIFVLNINQNQVAVAFAASVQSSPKSYAIPSALYALSILPHAVEVGVACLNDVPPKNRGKGVSQKADVIPFNVTSGNIN